MLEISTKGQQAMNLKKIIKCFVVVYHCLFMGGVNALFPDVSTWAIQADFPSTVPEYRQVKPVSQMWTTLMLGSQKLFKKSLMKSYLTFYLIINMCVFGGSHECLKEIISVLNLYG